MCSLGTLFLPWVTRVISYLVLCTHQCVSRVLGTFVVEYYIPRVPCTWYFILTNVYLGYLVFSSWNLELCTHQCVPRVPRTWYLELGTWNFVLTSVYPGSQWKLPTQVSPRASPCQRDCCQNCHISALQWWQWWLSVNICDMSYSDFSYHWFCHLPGLVVDRNLSEKCHNWKVTKFSPDWTKTIPIQYKSKIKYLARKLNRLLVHVFVISRVFCCVVRMPKFKCPLEQFAIWIAPGLAFRTI